MPAAYFDMDGTLLKGDSNDFLVRYLLKEQVIDQNFTAPIADFHHRYLKGELAIEDFVVFIIKPFIGMSAQRRKELIAGCLTSGGLLAALRPGGLAEIKRRQALGDDIFIVTSTIDCLIEPIAAHLGVKYVAAAPLEYDAEGKVTGRIAGLVPYQGQKVTRIQEILQREGISNADSAAFGDSVNDFEMLCFAEHGKAVHPSPLLLDKAKAQGRSFEILNWDQA